MADRKTTEESRNYNNRNVDMREQYERLAFEVVRYAFDDYIKYGLKREEKERVLRGKNMPERKKEEVAKEILTYEKNIMEIETFIKNSTWIDYVWNVPSEETMKMLKKRTVALMKEPRRRKAKREA